MKRFPVLILAAAAALALVACGGGGGEESTAAGSATTESLLSLLPASTMGVLAFNIHEAMQTEPVRKQLADPEAADKMEEFIRQTGIDPREDVRLMVVGLTGAAGNEPEGAAIINLRYDRANLLAKIKAESETEIQEEDYQGYTIYSALPPDEDKPVAGVFLDDSNIAVGQLAAVEQVIDLHRERGRGALDSEVLKPVIQAANTDALFWAAFAIPAGAVGQMAGDNPMLENLKDLKALTLFFDYGRGMMEAEIKALGGTEAQNRQISEMLTGLKAFGGMAAAQEPALGDVLDSIQISAGTDFVKIAASIPDEVLEKLGRAAQDRVSGLMKPKEEDPEKKEEIR